MLLLLKNKYDALFERAGQRNATAFLERMAVSQARCTQSPQRRVSRATSHHHCTYSSVYFACKL